MKGSAVRSKSCQADGWYLQPATSRSKQTNHCYCHNVEERRTMRNKEWASSSTLNYNIADGLSEYCQAFTTVTSFVILLLQ